MKILCTAVFALLPNWVALSSAQMISFPVNDPVPAPIPPPITFIHSLVEPDLRTFGTTVYNIGDPSPEEQLYVELINRARADPSAEALRFANTTDPDVIRAMLTVDVDLMLEQFATIPPMPPLAINPLLTEAARRHTTDMFDNHFQGHTGSDGTQPHERVQQTGYNLFTIGENVYSYARSVFYGHAGFEVDWGDPASPNTVGGMQNPPGHRNSTHKGIFREVGVGVILGQNGPVGPQLVTQELGMTQNATPFITGVAYYDLNGNSFYDVGEGIGNVTVEAGSTVKGITARSGGYAVPVPGNGTYAVTFSGGGFTPVTRNVTVSGLENEKMDFTPAYSPPAVLGPDNPTVGRPNAYTISAVSGAAEYEWRFLETIPASAEGAENRTNNITIDQSAEYDVIQGVVKKSGASAFQLMHVAGGGIEAITFRSSFLLSSNSELSFQSRLGLATKDEHAQVQLSLDDGANWQTVHTQAGSGGVGETVFSRKTVSLSGFAGKDAVRLRFAYSFLSGQYFREIGSFVGWMIDDIEFTGVNEIAEQQISAANTGSFQFTPSGPGTYVLQARAKTGHTFLDWGEMNSVNAVPSTATPEYQISGIKRVGGEVHLTIDLSTGSAPANLSVESTARLNEAWSNQAAAVQNGGTTQLLLKMALPTTSTRFYRLRAD